MAQIENINGGQTSIRKSSEARSSVRKKIEGPVRTLAPRRPRLEQLPSSNAARTKERGFVQVIENRETGFFEGMFSFTLTGVVINGRLPVCYDPQAKGKGTTSDRLMSRLLPLLDGDSNLRFRFGGGGEANFSWDIQGITQNAKTEEAAVAAAFALRRDLQMILASEPNFRFSPERLWDTASTKPFGDHWKASIVPRGFALRIPQKSHLGFAGCPKAENLQDVVLHLAVPRPGLPSFNSLAEAVLKNPDPVSMEVILSSYKPDAQAQLIISDALKWMESSPGDLLRQLAELKLDSAVGEHLQNQLRAWLQNPVGERLECHISSPGRLSDSFVTIVGEDVFWARVNFLPQPIDHRDRSKELISDKAFEGSLNLVRCLHPVIAWPFLFPNVEAIAGARVKRLYNTDIPDFGKTGIVLGHVAECHSQRVRISEQARSQHQYLLGSTGAGKSTLLFNMIIQDIRAGRGVGVIDPHGDLYAQLLESLPLSRAADVFLFNPGSSDMSPGINPIECKGPNRAMQVNFIINELLKTFERLYDMRRCGGPVFETYFRNAMLLLLESGLEEVALTELSLVFEDPDYRNYLKSRCTNPMVVSFWSNQAEKTTGEAALTNLGPYIASKVNAFTCNAIIRPIIGQATSTIDFRHILDNRGIFLARLTKGALGEMDTQLLGSFLLSKIFIAAMGRSNLKPNQRSIFHLYVDEFQNFTTDTVAYMLSEARKFGLYLTLANQTLSQLNANHGHQNLCDAVLGNIGNLVSFRVGPADAEKLHAYVQPEFNALDLQGLPNYNAIARLMTGKGPTRPFVFNTHPAIMPRGYAVAKQSTLDFRTRVSSKSIEEIEKQIIKRRTIHKNFPKPDVRTSKILSAYQAASV